MIEIVDPYRRLRASCGRAGWTGNYAQNLRFRARGAGRPDDPHRGGGSDLSALPGGGVIALDVRGVWPAD